MIELNIDWQNSPQWLVGRRSEQNTIIFHAFHFLTPTAFLSATACSSLHVRSSPRAVQTRYAHHWNGRIPCHPGFRLVRIVVLSSLQKILSISLLGKSPISHYLDSALVQNVFLGPNGHESSSSQPSLGCGRILDQLWVRVKYRRDTLKVGRRRASPFLVWVVRRERIVRIKLTCKVRIPSLRLAARLSWAIPRQLGLRPSRNPALSGIPDHTRSFKPEHWPTHPLSLPVVHPAYSAPPADGSCT